MCKIIKKAKIADDYSSVIELDVKALRQGLVIAYPTETVYGLGCDGFNKKAVKAIYRIKGRSWEKSLVYLAASLEAAMIYAKFNKTALVLAKSFWPGPLTLVLPATPTGRRLLGVDSLALRVSSHPLANELARALDGLLVSTSANPSGLPPAASGRKVRTYFLSSAASPDLIIDVGSLKKSKSSTVVDCCKKEPLILRQGDLTLDFKLKA
jgi:L-threonylcarbamoyladenylate synthase